MASQDSAVSARSEAQLRQRDVHDGHEIRLPQTDFRCAERRGDDTTEATEQDPLQIDLVRGHSSALPTPLNTVSRTSINTSSPMYQPHVAELSEELRGPASSGETQGFLPKKRPASTSTGSKAAQPHNSHSSLLKTWRFEIASLLVAVGALVAMVIIMAKFNSKEQPSWKYALNLNTLMAILSTLLRACIVVVVEEVVSQLKWMQFRQPKPLRYLEYYDDASRGPWGSLQLFFRLRSIHSSFLACIVIILSVGIGPFTQQAVKTRSCEIPIDSSETSISVSRWMPSFNLGIQLPHRMYLDDADHDTKIAVLNGMNNMGPARFQLNPDCSTGNCTFPVHNGVTHSSIGMCKRCVDTTPWLSKGDIDHISKEGLIQYGVRDKLTLPDKTNVGGWPGAVPTHIAQISGHSAIWSKSNASRPWDGLLRNAFDRSFDDIFRSSLFNVSMVSITNNGCEPQGDQLKCPEHNLSSSWLHLVNIVATSCSFYPCVLDYHGSVQDTVFTEKIVQQTPIFGHNSSRMGGYQDYMHFHTPCIIDNQIYTIDNTSSLSRDNHNFTSYPNHTDTTFPTECFYGVDGAYISGLAGSLLKDISGNCTREHKIIEGQSSGYKLINCDPWHLKGLVDNGNASFESIDAHMQSIANGITYEMRKQGTDYDDWISTELKKYNMSDSSRDQLSTSLYFSKEPRAIFVKGTVLRTTICTQFDWKWLFLPAALLSLALISLCITYVKTLFDEQMVPAWKSSLLPLPFIGSHIGDYIHAGDIDGLEADTRKVVVSLSHNGEGWEFISDDISESEQ